VVLLVALGIGVVFWAFRQLASEAETREHSENAIGKADELLSDLKDAETGERGYAITGDRAFLGPYLAVRDGIGARLDELRQLSLASSAIGHVDAMAPLIDARMAELERVIRLKDSHDAAAVTAAISGGAGKRSMDSIRDEIRAYVQDEGVTLAAHESKFQSDMRLLLVALAVGSLVILLFALAFAYLAFREMHNRLKGLLHAETELKLEIQRETSERLHQANVSLQASEERLAVTLHSIGDGLITTDAKARIMLMNPVAEELTGWTQAEAANHPVDEVFNIINHETRKPSVVPVRETLEKGTVHGLANHTVLVARGGGECAIADSCAPIRDRSGAVVGAVLVFRDVTGEFAAQQAVRDQQFYTRSLIEANVDALMTCSPSGVVADVNQQMEALTGCAREELIGRPFKDFFTDPGLAEEGIRLVLRDKKVSNYELTARARDGRETVVSFNASTFFDREGRLQGVFAAARDITERKHFERALEATNAELHGTKSAAESANLAKSDFLSSMSHELRSPLNAILGFAQLMESETPPPSEKQAVRIKQILLAGWHLLNLINEILDLTVIESGKVSLSRESVSLEEVMSECRAIMEEKAQERHIVMTFPRFDSPVYVWADRTRLKQVVINLLSNAIKYNKDKGAVVVDCKATSRDRTQISVRDTGAGLVAEKMAQLFQPFNRLGQEAGGVAGTGIGLVLTKQLVELMKGAIAVESTSGKGSVFKVELPSAAAPEIPAGLAGSAEQALPRDPIGERQRTLLYVEDNPANLMVVEQLVARFPDLKLMIAVNGTIGIEIARAHQPEVILMDINLPGMNGVAALKILQGDPATAHIPVVAVSANAMPRDVRRGLDEGFFRYLTKPIRVKEFMETLNEALEFAEKTPVGTNGAGPP
jgi:PAS domain S-box-containing protein